MSIQIHPFEIGPLQNNSYLLQDNILKTAAIIDPSFGSLEIWEYCQANHLQITDILCTHAHFDHIAGLNEIIPLVHSMPRIWLHPKDLPLWQASGGAKNFGFPFEIKDEPTDFFSDMQVIDFGEDSHIQVRHTPGHSPGHVVFFLQSEGVVFCGDLIFRQSVGRTDLAGGNHLLLLKSIDQCITNLPDETRLLSGHGPETTVGYEKKYNPFL